VWFVGLRTGYLIAALSVLAGATNDLTTSPEVHHWYFVAWNNAVEAVIYALLVHLLSALHARVASEVKMRVEALDQLRHTERLSTVGKLAAGVAHEIGTPLNIITGHCELMLEGLNPDELQSSVRIVRAQVERITTVVRQLLDFSRRAGVGRKRTDLRELAEEAITLFKPMAEKRRIHVVGAGVSVQAEVNTSEIQQVIANLVANAIHAMSSAGKGGKIEVKTDAVMAVHPDQSGHRSDRYVRLTVRDEGPGIPDEVLPCIFDPFFTTKDVGEGTGLGLSVAYGIIKDHGGWIAVDTALGTGTSFHVHLPHGRH
jgi:two-component system NtrC family sensor kinase